MPRKSAKVSKVSNNKPRAGKSTKMQVLDSKSKVWFEHTFVNFDVEGQKFGTWCYQVDCVFTSGLYESIK